MDSGSLELIGELSEVAGVKAVFSVEPEYFVDRGAGEIFNGDYTLHGKQLVSSIPRAIQ